MVEINIVQQKSGETKLQLANGIDFEHKNLALGLPAQNFINFKNNDVYNYLGSCEVENESIGLGAHHILEGANQRHFLVNDESFTANFQRVKNLEED